MTEPSRQCQNRPDCRTPLGVGKNPTYLEYRSFQSQGKEKGEKKKKKKGTFFTALYLQSVIPEKSRTHVQRPELLHTFTWTRTKDTARKSSKPQPCSLGNLFLLTSK